MYYTRACARAFIEVCLFLFRLFLNFRFFLFFLARSKNTPYLYSMKKGEKILIASPHYSEWGMHARGIYGLPLEGVNRELFKQTPRTHWELYKKFLEGECKIIYPVEILVEDIPLLKFSFFRYLEKVAKGEISPEYSYDFLDTLVTACLESYTPLAGIDSVLRVLYPQLHEDYFEGENYE